MCIRDRNLGLNDEVATGFTKITNNERFVYDSYRRFIQMFADVVMGFPKSSFERKFDDIKEEKGVEFDTDLTAEDLKEVVAIYKDCLLYTSLMYLTGMQNIRDVEPFPRTPRNLKF